MACDALTTTFVVSSSSLKTPAVMIGMDVCLCLLAKWSRTASLGRIVHVPELDQFVAEEVEGDAIVVGIAHERQQGLHDLLGLKPFEALDLTAMVHEDDVIPLLASAEIIQKATFTNVDRTKNNKVA